MKKKTLIAGIGLIAGAVGMVRLAAAEAGGASAAPQSSASPVKLSAQESRFFESKVRPILANRCYECHSIEQKKSKGGLTLDTREGWMKGGTDGPVIVSGDIDKSRLITAVMYDDVDLQMPPKGNKLPDEEIAVLKEWVKMGAPDPRVAPAGGAALTGLTDKAKAHWAYQPVTAPAVPEIKNRIWANNEVDAFILTKLEANGMKPSEQAAKEALIRRATYDLHGLPPTPGEVLSFVRDASPNAFEKVIDRLLASPRYGERWGRFWLDTARYSDTSGIENNNRREEYRYPYAWTYRDYVINSFNEDKPYDQFLREQIAADLLPGAQENPESLAALGFITVGKRFQNPNDTIDERIDALTKATMAMTVSCARCHDHKFDPIPTADYYSLHGVFVSTVEPSEKPYIAGKPKGPTYEEYKRKLAELEEKNREVFFNMVERSGTEFRKKAAPYVLVSALTRAGGAGANRDRLKQRNDLISKYNLDRDIYQGGLRNFRPLDPVFAPLARFAQLGAGNFGREARDLIEEISTGKLNRRIEINPLVVEAFKNVDPSSIRSMEDVADVYGELFASIDSQAAAYIRACRAAKSETIEGYSPALVQLIEVPAKVVPAAGLDSDKLREMIPTLPAVNNNAIARFHFAEINELELTHPGAPARAMAVRDADNPRNSPIFVRGEAQNRGPIVPRQFLEILSGSNRQPFKSGSGRLELSNLIAARENPLTARVMVNRIWMHHFGQGFVRTPDDLGVQSEAPSHPELLDYLATRFMNDGWSMKKMHRLIMSSAAYQQSSDTHEPYAEKDPENRLVWRANLRRLDFEAIRDSLLLFTGKMDKTVGGKPVNLTDEPYSNRRSVYGYIDRGQLPELMSQFDFPDADMANSQRTSTIVPQQALFFMNSPMAVDVARKVTSRPEFVNAPSDRERVRVLYLTLFQRTPKPNEVKLAMDFVQAKRVDDRLEAAEEEPREQSVREEPRVAARRAELRRQEMKRQEMERMRRPQPQNQRGAARRPIQNEGQRVERKPLDVWEQYAQALLFANEMAYVN